MALLTDYIARHPDSIVTITCSTAGINLMGILSDAQVVQALSADYGQGFKGLIASAGQSMSQAGGNMGGKTGGALGVGGALLSKAGGYATSKHTLLGTVKVFEGSSDISVPMSIVVVPNFGGNGNHKALDLMINKMTQPKLLSGDLLTSYFYDLSDLEKDPTGAGALNFFKGKLPAVKIGNWFHAKDVYITNVNKADSSVLNEDESPAAVFLSFQLSPYRQLTAEDLNEWILR